MIRRSLSIAVVAGGLSALAHAGVLSVLWSEEPVLIEGGAEEAVARLGNSFRDVAAGTLTARSPERLVQTVKPEAVQSPVTTSDEAPQLEANAIASHQTTARIAAVSPEPASSPGTTSPRVMKPLRATAGRAEPAPLPRSTVTAIPPAAPSNTPVAAMAPTPAQPLPTPRLEAEEAVTAPQRLAAKPTDDGPAPLLSRRPSLRPARIEAKAEARRPAPRNTTKQTPKRRQIPSGNGQTAERRGSEQGQKQANVRTASEKPAKKATAAGNAAASNYPGTVMRRIQRNKPRTNIRGTAVVSFAIAPSGRLASLSLAKSSGSAKLDQIALNAVKRASPFPRPPSGATTRLSLSVQGR